MVEANEEVLIDDLGLLFAVLPTHVSEWIISFENYIDLLEVSMDLGRPARCWFPEGDIIANKEITREDINLVLSKLKSFGDDNRAGIDRTLHRVSCMRNRNGDVVGLSCRVGRAVFGAIKVIEDLILDGKSVLLLGRPGVGKTTMLREVARTLADKAGKRVIVVDTSNEIAGDSDIPHSAIGLARRMQVKSPIHQHSVMIEAVENHMPQAIVIDEMGTEQEALAARSIAEKGVQLIATAHGNTMDNLIMNPTLCELLGGIQSVVLGDEEARRRGSRKTILERKAPATFDALVEIQDWHTIALHIDLSDKVDALLRGFSVSPEIRTMNGAEFVTTEGDSVRLNSSNNDGFFSKNSSRANGIKSIASNDYNQRSSNMNNRNGVKFNTLRVFPYGVSRERLINGANNLGVELDMVSNAIDSDTILTTKAQYKKKSEMIRLAQEKGIPIYVLRRNTQAQIDWFLKGSRYSDSNNRMEKTEQAVEEAESAVLEVLNGEESVELTPQTSYIRRLQHLAADRYNINSVSMGKDPNRRVIFWSNNGGF